jgi:predicted MFS family arabinose efflux permease
VLAMRAGDVFRPARSADRPAGVLRQVAQGAAALRAHPQAMRLVGADLTGSVVFGAQTVLLLLVSRQIGLGSQGYGYLFAGLGVGGLVGTALAGRASRSSHPRWILAAAMAAIGLPMLLLAPTRWPAIAIFLAGLTGAGGVLVEILTDTCLQRVLDQDVLGRAYGLALPAAIGGIAAGSLIAPLLARALGLGGALGAVGGAVLGYAVVLLRQPEASPGTPQAAQPAVAADAPAR